jgi:glycosyltransferase involved in cell wall biosynthesis
MKRRSACFFARVADPEILRRVEFYAQDIRLLRELGFDVRVATRPQDLRPADLYFIWWWTWALCPITAASLQRRPSLVTGVFDDADNLRRPRWQRKLVDLALRQATMNVFCSRLEHQSVPRQHAVRSPRYVPLSVDTEVYRPLGERAHPCIFTVAWTGEHNAVRKCIPEIVRAAAIVHRTYPALRFVIAGERGGYYPRLAGLIRQLGAESYVEFPGVISRAAKVDLMQRCQLFLQPSRFEGFGLAILEAMSCGAPVVTSPSGVVPEVVGEAARFVDGTSPEAIADGVLALLGDASERRALGQRARERAQREFPFARRKHEMSRLLASLPDQGPRALRRRGREGAALEPGEPARLSAPGD